MVKGAVYDAVGLSIFVLMTDALTRAKASISVQGRRSAAVYIRLRYAPCLTLQTPCVALLFILDLHYAEQPYSIPPQKTHTEYGVCFCCVNTSSYYVCSLFVQLHSIHSEFTLPGSPFEDALTLIFILLYDLKFSIRKEEYPICVISENSPLSNEI